MITEKTRISKDFPIKVKVFFNTNNMYLFPQGFTSSGSMSKSKYNSEKSISKDSVYTHQYYDVIYKYFFKWLFLTIIFESNLIKKNSVDYVQNNYRQPNMRKEVIFNDFNNN